ncbi:unnamed protein product [Sympodiomycopsis kandeliae]
MRSSSPWSPEVPTAGGTSATDFDDKRLTFTSRLMDTEVEDCIKVIRQKADLTAFGVPGPHPIGHVSEDVFERTKQKISTVYKLSFGINSDSISTNAFRVTVDIASRKEIVLGLVLFWGDPALLHNLIAQDLLQATTEDAKMPRRIFTNSGGDRKWVGSCGITVQKEPDAAWQGSRSETPTDVPLCVAEIAWGNESTTLLRQERSLWSSRGVNAIGIKVQLRGSSGDADASKELNHDDDHRSFSVLFLFQAAGTKNLRVWSFGPEVRTRVTLLASEGTSALLPMNTFTRAASETGHALFCLESIAITAHAYTQALKEQQPSSTAQEEKQILRLLKAEIAALTILETRNESTQHDVREMLIKRIRELEAVEEEIIRLGH